MWRSIKGKDAFQSRPITNRESKKILLWTYVYFSVIFPASIAWAVYVFSNNIWGSVLSYFVFVFPIAMIIPMQRHMSKTLPKPPPGGWPDEKAKSDAFAKWRDARQERFYNPKYLIRIFIISFVAIAIVVGIITAIMVFTIGR